MSGATPLGLEIAWLVAATLFVAGLRRMSTPRGPRRGVWLAGGGMLLAVGATFAHPALDDNLALLCVALVSGVAVAAWPALRVSPTDIPRMVALYNALGGAAAGCVAIVGLLRLGAPVRDTTELMDLATPGLALYRPSLYVVALLVGAIASSGSIALFLRLRREEEKPEKFAGRQVIYVANATVILLLGLLLAASRDAHPVLLLLFTVLCSSFGVLMTLPIARADLPVLIALYNALTGLAVAIDGFVIANPAMIIAGAIVFAAGSLLMRLMARARNRRLGDIMYSGFGLEVHGRRDDGPSDRVNRIDASEAAIALGYAGRVVIVPGYGMAVAQAHHKLRELVQLLEERGVSVVFAIHPVAGRMPGHMNVLLSEAGVPYERIVDLVDINPDFSNIDVALVVGADDIVNPAARDSRPNALQGLSILDVDLARQAIVLKRGDGVGHSGVANPLMTAPRTRVLSGDAGASIQALIEEVKALD